MRSFSSTLAFYLGRRFFTTTFLTTLLLGIFVFLLDFVEVTRRLSGKSDIASDTAMQLVLLKMPHLLLDIAPFAILLATLVCLSRLNRDSELIAIRASGVPARQFLFPPLIVCFIIGVFNLAALNPFAAATLKNYQRLEAEIFPGSTHGLVTKGGHIWLKQSEKGQDYIIYAKSVQASGTRLDGTTVFRFSHDGDFVQRMDAPQMVMRGKEWRLENVLLMRPGVATERQSSVVLPTNLTPQDIRNSFSSPQTLSVWELGTFIDRLKNTGLPTQAHEMRFQRLLASPLFILAMFLLGAPFALHFSRQRSLANLIVIGVTFGFLFYLFTTFTSAFGMAGRINIMLAAWLPTIIASLLALSLFLHFREE